MSLVAVSHRSPPKRSCAIPCFLLFLEDVHKDCLVAACIFHTIVRCSIFGAFWGHIVVGVYPDKLLKVHINVMSVGCVNKRSVAGKS